MHGPPHRAPSGLPVAPLVMLALLGFAGGGVAAVVATAVLVFAAPVVLLVLGAVALAGGPRRHPLPAGPRARPHGHPWGFRHGPGPHAWPGPLRPVQVPGTGPRPIGGPRVSTWAGTRTSFARLQREYAAFECDPLAVLRTPALADVSVPSTGRFVDAFAEAQALDTDVVPPPQHQARAAAAVDRAWRSWRAARDAAERIRLAGVPAQERAAVEKAIKLLTVARDSGSEPERAAAYARARAELGKLERTGALRLPTPAAAALDVAARSQLPPGRAGGPERAAS